MHFERLGGVYTGGAHRIYCCHKDFGVDFPSKFLYAVRIRKGTVSLTQIHPLLALNDIIIFPFSDWLVRPKVVPANFDEQNISLAILTQYSSSSYNSVEYISCFNDFVAL